MGLKEHTVGDRGKHQGQTSGELEILGWRWAMPRLADDPMRKLEMLGWIQATPKLAEDPMWWKSRGLEKQRRRGNRYITLRKRV